MCGRVGVSVTCVCVCCAAKEGSSTSEDRAGSAQETRRRVQTKGGGDCKERTSKILFLIVVYITPRVCS